LHGLVAQRERGVGLPYIRVEDLDDVVEPVLDQKPDRGGVELRGRVDVEKANKLIHLGSAKIQARHTVAVGLPVRGLRY